MTTAKPAWVRRQWRAVLGSAVLIAGGLFLADAVQRARIAARRSADL